MTSQHWGRFCKQGHSIKFLARFLAGFSNMKWQVLEFWSPSSSASALHLPASVPVVISFPRSLELQGLWSTVTGACFPHRAG